MGKERNEYEEVWVRVKKVGETTCVSESTGICARVDCTGNPSEGENVGAGSSCKGNWEIVIRRLTTSVVERKTSEPSMMCGPPNPPVRLW